MNTHVRKTNPREREAGQNSTTRTGDRTGRRVRVWQWVVLGVVGVLAVGAGTTYLAYARDMQATRDRLAAGSQLMPLATGGHLLLGHHAEVQAKANAFLQQYATVAH